MAKKAGTTRVHQLAKELGVDSKDIIAKCQAEEIPDIVNHMSTVSVGLCATIREWFSEGVDSANSTAVETAAAVDLTKVRAKARRKATKKTESSKATAEKKASEEATQAAEQPQAEAEQPAKTEPEAAPTLAAEAAAVPLEAPELLAQPPVEVELGKATAKPITAPMSESDTAASEPEAPAATPAPQQPAAAAAAPQEQKKDAASENKAKPKVQPVMNVPTRPGVVKPAGPMLQQPSKTKLAGPKVIRVESPEIIPPPRSRSGPRTSPTVGRGGPRAGRGAGAGMGDGLDIMTGRDRGAGSRRNKRRSASAHDEGGRSGRGSGQLEEVDRHFNWREQDLLERENRLNRAGGFFKAARRDNLKRVTGGGQRAVVPAQAGGKVKISVPISIKDLSAATGVKVSDLLRKLLLQGKMLNVNSVVDGDTAMELMLDYNIELDIEEQKSAGEKIAEQFRERVVTDERRRSPVVTILGHVDHGKTSLLDRIRNTNVAAGEAGGITQATSAFQVPVVVGDETRMVTFIDTPGHEAFTEMRARGAKVTDVAVLVVAADDGVMPQTIESINHAKAAGVPIVVALNKIDKPEASDTNIQRILGQLAEHDLNPVEWGGSTEVVRTSALTGAGIQELLEMLDYQAQLLDLKADFAGEAEGTVLEAAMEEGRGPVAKVIVQQGQLKKGDFVVVGRAFGRVRDIVNDRGVRIDTAGPSMPVAFSGISDVPDAGDKFYIVKSLKEAEQAAAERARIERERDLARERITLDNVFKHMAATGRKELALIVKADVQGSLETLKSVLSKIESDEVNISIKHAAIGGVNESDVTLAETTNAIIVGFNVTASASARKAAEARGVDIRFYDVIYDLTDDVKAAAEGLLEPEVKLEVLGHAEVRDVFKISKVGMVAGCYVTDGVIERNSQIRVTRDGIVIEKDRRLQQLKRFKDDVKEVRAGQECGMKIDGYDDIRVGDVLECYKTREVKRKL